MRGKGRGEWMWLLISKRRKDEGLSYQIVKRTMWPTMSKSVLVLAEKQEDKSMEQNRQLKVDPVT